MTRRVGFLSLLLCLVLADGVVTGCQTSRAAEPETYQVKFEDAIPYGNVGDRPLLLYIVRPDPVPRAPMPAIVYLHGGGWMTERSPFSPNDFFARHGYFTVNVDYRLTDEAIWPAQIQDAKAAVRWLRAHATEYNIDPDHIGVWGYSAGGQLAAMLGTAGDVKEFEGDAGSADQSSRVQAVVNMAGVIDLTKQAWDLNQADTAGALLVGGPISQKLDVVKTTNPITYITKDDAPTLTVHGLRDTAVPLEQSAALHLALTKAGVPSDLLLFEDMTHQSFYGVPPEVRALLLDFFDRHLRVGSARA
jgi:acetyl esterase/lipase